MNKFKIGDIVTSLYGTEKFKIVKVRHYTTMYPYDLKDLATESVIKDVKEDMIILATKMKVTNWKKELEAKK